MKSDCATSLCFPANASRPSLKEAVTGASILGAMAGANQMGQMGPMSQMGSMGQMGIPQAVMAAQAPGMITGVYRDMCEYKEYCPLTYALT